jgi:hypothetical protein
MKTVIAILALPFATITGVALTACETEDPTYAVVDNDYPISADGGAPALDVAVYKVWWSSSLFSTPVGAGLESSTSRVETGSDHAYALLAPGWDPASTSTPTTLVPVRTRDALFVTRGGTLHIRLSDTTVVGNCGAQSSGPLPQAEADFITERIFPGEFTAGTYAASTCTLRVPVTTGDASTLQP